MDEPRYLDAGEAALVVEFGGTVDPAINDRVIALDAALSRCAPPGIRELVPTYRSLMILYDPLQTGRTDLIDAVRRAEASPAAAGRTAGRWTVPCCYDAEFGEDIGHIAATMGLTADQVVALHASAEYRVYMYGFAPGFAYLGGLPAALAISRRPAPRPPIPPNTLMIGGGLAAVACTPMPTGWWLVGRTPERMFAPSRDPVFLVGAGDSLRFEPISRDAFELLDARAAAGEVVARQEPPA
jgi:KipI family sensor histidine kinase inhibitor